MLIIIVDYHEFFLLSLETETLGIHLLGYVKSTKTGFIFVGL